MTKQKVDYVGIGVQKAATTWVYSQLIKHPDISKPFRKEVHFFNSVNFLKGYWWYHKHFPEIDKITGEISTSYFYNPAVPKRIHEYNPAIKLILCLRDPVDRAFSQHKHEFKRNRLPGNLLEFEKALQQNPSYIEQGQYGTHLKRYLKYFDPKQIHIIFQEQIIQNPEKIVKNLYDFLDVDPSFKPKNLNEREGESYSYKNRTFKNFLNDTGDFLRNYFGKKLTKVLKATSIPGFLKELNKESIEESALPPLKKSTEQKLRDQFLPEINKLENLIDKDLSNWKKSS